MTPANTITEMAVESYYQKSAAVGRQNFVSGCDAIERCLQVGYEVSAKEKWGSVMAAELEQNGRGYMMLLVGDERRTSDAALGIALRGAGHGLRVHIIEFLKTGRERGEVAAVSFLTGVTLSQYGMIDVRTRPEEFRGPAISPERLQAALREARDHVLRRVTNILILDGLLTLVDEGMVEDKAILELVERAAPWTDIVLTGRAASPALHDAADSVTLMQTIKVREHEPLRRGLHY